MIYFIFTASDVQSAEMNCFASTGAVSLQTVQYQYIDQTCLSLIAAYTKRQTYTNTNAIRNIRLGTEHRPSTLTDTGAEKRIQI